MLAIVGTVGVPACYGGFETLVENLLGEGDEPVLVYCSSKKYSERKSSYKNAKLVYIPLEANGVSSIFYDIWSIFSALLRGADTLLILGVSGAIALPFVRLFTRARVVTNIDGLEWKRDKWSSWAKRYLKFSERLAVKYSHEVIADNQCIADHVRDSYQAQSHVIAYGGEHAVPNNPPEVVVSDYALALCRIEPENNVHLILEAFSLAKAPLTFVGNWEASTYGQELKAKYAKDPSITILDPIYSIEKLYELRAGCSFYVHGHSAGGTNPSLVEMMHFAKPIICFDCGYNRATTEDLALFFADVPSLIDTIKKLPDFASSDMGLNLKSLAQQRYVWPVIKSQYLNLCSNK